MTNIDLYIANTLWLIVPAVAAITVWHFAFMPLMRDCFRYRVFKERRSLFRYMAEGNIESSNPAYVELYSRINAVLQSAEHLSLTRLLVIVALRRHIVRLNSSDLDAALGKLSPVERKRLDAVRLNIGKLIVIHAAVTSPLAWATAIIAMIAVAGISVGYLLFGYGAATVLKLLNQTLGKLFDKVAVGEREVAYMPHGMPCPVVA